MASFLDKINKKSDSDKASSKKEKSKADTSKKEKKLNQASENIKTKKESYSYDLAHKVLLRPLVSEKGTYLQEQNKYFFEVAKDANKIMVKRAVEYLYNVDVIKVNIQNRIGKRVRFGRVSGRRKNWKRAVVTLKAGQRITTVEGV
jgi:large subunit ribosomal protein L23